MGDFVDRETVMKRIIDLHYYSFIPYSAAKTGICVKCPSCGRQGMVMVVGAAAHFRCSGCGNMKEKTLSQYRASVHAHCKKCGKYFREEVTEYRNCSAAHVTCPECGTVMSGRVDKIPIKNGHYISEGVNDSHEPFFGFELWYSASFDGKPVWALNREHLDYLIEYLSAELREKRGVVMKTQADHIPAFMKSAKNRDRIVKVLTKLKNK